MPPPGDSLPPEARDFIHRHLPSVEQLETLLLLWRTRPRTWTPEEISHELGSTPASIAARCEDLARRGFVARDGDGRSRWLSDQERDAGVELMARVYRERRVSVITAIACRPNELLRTFADAFRIRPKPDPPGEGPLKGRCMEGMVYLLSAATAAACSWLLLRAWRRSTAARLLWCGLCFVLLAASNLMLYADKILLPMRDLSLWRESLSLAGVLVLIGGLILDGEQR